MSWGLRGDHFSNQWKKPWSPNNFLSVVCVIMKIIIIIEFEFEFFYLKTNCLKQ